jgi:hypothetical protein
MEERARSTGEERKLAVESSVFIGGHRRITLFNNLDDSLTSPLICMRCGQTVVNPFQFRLSAMSDSMKPYDPHQE